MAWYYFVKSRKLFHNDKFIAEGYTGNTIGLNNPSFQWLKNIGPIPSGKYKIGKPRFSEKLKHEVLDLTPIGHNSLSRSAFLIHGDNKNRNNSASNGCIILGKEFRKMIAESTDEILIVCGIPTFKA